MKLVVHLSDFGWPVETAEIPTLLRDVAGLSEAGGFDGIAVADHLWSHPIMGGPETNCLEAYTTLTYLAAHTRSIRLLTVVTGAHFRRPALLAKTVTTLDVLSGGRMWLGIGAGHYEEECEGLGIPFPPLATRYELLEDALEVCLRMWSGDHGDDKPYTGHHVAAERMLNVPQSVQRPHPPILIAGVGERRTLALVARYGDACSLRRHPTSATSSTCSVATATRPGRTTSASSARVRSSSPPTTAVPRPRSCSIVSAGSPTAASTPSSAVFRRSSGEHPSSSSHATSSPSRAR